MSEVNEKIEELNSKYLNAKEKFEEFGEISESIEKELAIKESELEIANSMLRIAIAKKSDKKDIVKIEDDCKVLKEDIKKIKSEAEEVKEILSFYKKSIDDKINELREDPEVAAYLNSIIEVRNERKAKKLTNKIESTEKKKEIVDSLKTIIKSNPKVFKSLKEIYSQHNKIKLLEAELGDANTTAARKDEIDKVELPKAKNELKKNNGKAILMALIGFANNDNKTFSEKDLLNVVDDFVVSNNGDIRLDATSKLYDVQIGKYKRQLEKNMQRVNLSNEAKSLDQEEPSESEVKNEFEIPVQEENNNAKLPLKTSFFQKVMSNVKNFINKIKNKFKAKEDVEEQIENISIPQEVTDDHKQSAKVDRDKHSSYINSLKYDIMKDALKAASRDAKKAKNSVNEEKEEEVDMDK